MTDASTLGQAIMDLILVPVNTLVVVDLSRGFTYIRWQMKEPKQAVLGEQASSQSQFQVLATSIRSPQIVTNVTCRGTI